MSKLVTRQAAKENSTAEKRTMDQAAQQDQPANKQMTRRAAKYQRRQGRQRLLQVERVRAVRRKRMTIVSMASAAVLLSAVLGYFLYTHAAGPSTNSSPAPSPTSVQSVYPAIDGISCDSSPHTNFHIHVHLTIYYTGVALDIPNNIGVAPDYSCFYWLHTTVNHGPTSPTVARFQHGVIHIEAPAEQAFTLGNFLDIWSQRFSTMSYLPFLDQMSPAWQVFVNGQPYTGDFHTIPLTQHALITLAYKSPGVQPVTTFPWEMIPGA